MSFKYVYLLTSLQDPSIHYVGLTEDLDARLAKHNSGVVPSTKEAKPWRMDVVTAFRDESKAAAFERYLKSHSGRAFSKRHF